MANLTSPIGNFTSSPGDEVKIAAAAVKIYNTAAVGVVIGTGYATNLVIATSGMQLVGIAQETVDNSAGSNGTKSVTIRRRGVFPFNQSGLTQASVEKKAYFLDDNNITTTPTAVEAGVITHIDSTGIAWVDINSAVRGSNAATGNSYTLTAPVTTTNVAGAAQIAATQTIPANNLKVGDKLKIRGQVMGAVRTASDTAALALYFGTTKVCDLAAALAHATTNWLYFDIEFVVRTAGASGTAYASGVVAGGTAGATLIGVNMASATFDTTVAEAFTIQVTFSASNTTDAIATNIFDVEVVRS